LEGWLHLPLTQKISEFRAIVLVSHKSTPTYTKSMPSPMETRKNQRPPNPRRMENQNILPFTMGKMTARRQGECIIGKNFAPQELSDILNDNKKKI
jgi:hypothetical protein